VTGTQQPAPATRSGAVAWVEPHRALVASTTPGGSVLVEEITADLAGAAPYIARVIDEIGDVERVAILGPSEERLIVEREYLLVYRDPERIVDVAHVEELDQADLLVRLRAITQR
jgi:hypothetical protein